MKKYLGRHLVQMPLRLVVGGVFLVAGLAKGEDAASFFYSLLSHDIIGSKLALVAAAVLPWIEIVIGIGLICGIGVQASSVIAGMLSLVFTYVNIRAFALGIDSGCGCFGSMTDGEIGWGKVFLSVALVGSSACLMLMSQTRRHCADVENRRDPEAATRETNGSGINGTTRDATVV